MPEYIGNPDFDHASPACTGILLTNLGTPDAPTPRALRRYLGQFLSDPRVIEVPRPIWWVILHGFILRTRPRRSAHSYAEIWTNEGSPLLAFASQQTIAVSHQVQENVSGPVQVELAMRYGNPSIPSIMEKLRRSGVQRLLVLPLYPQYSATTTGSTFDAVSNYLQKSRWLPELRFVTHYHDEPGYIAALARSVESHWKKHGRAEKLLFSFHGIPKHYFEAGDPYHCECHKTARLVAESLGMDEGQWQVTFQSRFGPREWLKPYTDETLRELAEKGIKNVSVICPGFSSDCLETLEEINIQYRALFLTSGGEEFTYIPALNDQPAHIDMIYSLVQKHCQGWPEFTEEWNQADVDAELKRRQERMEKVAASHD